MHITSAHLRSLRSLVQNVPQGSVHFLRLAPELTPMTHRLRHTFAPGDATALAGLLAELGWGNASDADHAEALLLGATWFALAEVESRVVGYARALSDRTTVTYLAEVGVAGAHRRRGIGSALLGALVGELGHTAIYAATAPEAVPLLTRHGIRARPEHFVACARKPTS